MSTRRRRFRRSLRNRREETETGFSLDKPREECSYKDIYSDLNPKKRLKIYVCNEPALENGTRNGEQNGNDNLDKQEAPTQIYDRHRGETSMTNSFGDGPIEPVKARDRQKGFRTVLRQDKQLYVERVMSAAGYQESEMFPMPEAYIRSSDFINDNIVNDYDIVKDDETGQRQKQVIRVEYDMDEQDGCFLDELNIRRVNQYAVPQVTKELFEISLTLLEVEWYLLEKTMPPKKKAIVENEISDADEQTCSVCDESECDNSNAIVFCDGCDLAVHQECYGVPFIPEGQWLCSKCTISRKRKASCVLCPNKSGALKMTDTRHWAHVLCALWVSETTIKNSIYMEPISGLDRIPKGRWKLNCYICKLKMGACIQCANKNCFQAFHPTCARKARLYMRMANGAHHALVDPGSLVAYCDKHSPPEYEEKVNVVGSVKKAQEHYAKFQDHYYIQDNWDSEAFHPTDSLTETKFVRKKSIIYKAWRTNQGTPVIPSIIVNRVSQIMTKFGVRKSRDYVTEICRYWALKRQMKRGAALSKRLQLALETLPNFGIITDNNEEKLSSLQKLLTSLERLKNLSSMVTERESLKLSLIENQMLINDIVYFSVHRLIWPIWRSIVLMNSRSNCLTVIHQDGISLTSMQAKVIHKFYDSLDLFSNDFDSLCALCLDSYKNDSSEYKAVIRLQKSIRSLIDQARSKEKSIKIDQLSGLADFKTFSPHGLDIQEEEWAGARILREMSPLSDMDDDVLEKLEQKIGNKRKRLLR